MLRNAFLLANVGADTAENEPNVAKNLTTFWQTADIAEREELLAMRSRGTSSARSSCPGSTRAGPRMF